MAAYRRWQDAKNVARNEAERDDKGMSVFRGGGGWYYVVPTDNPEFIRRDDLFTLFGAWRKANGEWRWNKGA